MEVQVGRYMCIFSTSQTTSWKCRQVLIPLYLQHFSNYFLKVQVDVDMCICSTSHTTLWKCRQVQIHVFLQHFMLNGIMKMQHNVLKYFIFRKCPDERKVWRSCDEMCLESQYWHTFFLIKITNTNNIIITVTQLKTTQLYLQIRYLIQIILLLQLNS